MFCLLKDSGDVSPGKTGSLVPLPSHWRLAPFPHCSSPWKMQEPAKPSQCPDPWPPAPLTCGPHGGLGHLEGAAPRAEAVSTVTAAPLQRAMVSIRCVTHTQSPPPSHQLISPKEPGTIIGMGRCPSGAGQNKHDIQWKTGEGVGTGTADPRSPEQTSDPRPNVAQ